MPLVEVVRAPRTDARFDQARVRRHHGALGQDARSSCGTRRGSSSTASTARSRSRRCGCSRPARRIVAGIDAAMRERPAIPMGPFELMDLTGIDVNARRRDRGVYEGLGRPDRLRPSHDPGAPGRGRALWPQERRRVLCLHATVSAAIRPSDLRPSARSAIRARRRSRADIVSTHRGEASPRARRGRSRRVPTVDRLALRLGAGHPRWPLRVDEPTTTGRRLEALAAAVAGRLAADRAPALRSAVRDLQRPLREAWIVEAVRTPIGSYGGALARVRPDDLAAACCRSRRARRRHPATSRRDPRLRQPGRRGQPNVARWPRCSRACR